MATTPPTLLKPKPKPKPNTKSFGCFRNKLELPSFEKIIGGYANKHLWEKAERIQCRKHRASLLEKVREDEEKKTIEMALVCESKIERVLRSKSLLDALFEFSPHLAWRQTCELQTNATIKDGVILHLDCKNFYPSIITNFAFPHPARLKLFNKEEIEKEIITKGHEINPGIIRAKLHLKSSAPNHLKHLHPFCLQSLFKSIPFELNKGVPIDTLLHTGELSIWREWFDIEANEGIISTEAIDHPLKYKVTEKLKELEQLKEEYIKNPSPETKEKIKTAKVLLTIASTTSKIATPRNEPSPYGAHCLSSQIFGLGRAMLTYLIHTCLEQNNQNRCLQINTDGFHLFTPKGNENSLLEHLTNLQMAGPNPGQLQLKSISDQGFFLGPNLWWTRTGEKANESCGLGEAKEKEFPTVLNYLGSDGSPKRIRLIHLADFRHELDHTTHIRTKPNISKLTIKELTNPKLPDVLITTEKARSLQETLKEWKLWRRSHKKLKFDSPSSILH